MQITSESLKNKKIAVLGFGIEGKSTAKFLLKHGSTVTIIDDKPESDFDSHELEEFKKRGAEFVFGQIPDLIDYDMIVRSPGIPLFRDEIQEARKAQVTITSPTKLFFDFSPTQNIIGVTGTKGKGTTASLIYEMLKEQGKEVFLGGNIGTPPLDFLASLTKDSIVVLELSSFQLEDMTKSPHIAVLLMVTSEHLAADQWGTKNYHKSIEEYIDAKRNLLRFQTKDDFAVVNHDYPASNESDIHTEGRVYYVSREQGVFQGAYIKDDAIWLKMDDREVEITKTKDILLPGKHNRENVCAALLGATLAGAQEKAIIKVLKSFKGLQHRLELIKTVGGVRYFDDSFSTTPETAIAAIEAFEDPEILILGGSTKGSDFSELGKIISEAGNIKAIISIGAEWGKIKAEIRGQKLEVRIVEGKENMREVVEAAAEIAELGDVVLLSPACASFDKFKNYKDRGEQFKAAVESLAN